jgi:hypothetical protein
MYQSPSWLVHTPLSSHWRPLLLAKVDFWNMFLVTQFVFALGLPNHNHYIYVFLSKIHFNLTFTSTKWYKNSVQNIFMRYLSYWPDGRVPWHISLSGWRQKSLVNTQLYPRVLSAIAGDHWEHIHSGARHVEEKQGRSWKPKELKCLQEGVQVTSTSKCSDTTRTEKVTGHTGRSAKRVGVSCRVLRSEREVRQ